MSIWKLFDKRPHLLHDNFPEAKVSRVQCRGEGVEPDAIKGQSIIEIIFWRRDWVVAGVCLDVWFADLVSRWTPWCQLILIVSVYRRSIENDRHVSGDVR